MMNESGICVEVQWKRLSERRIPRTCDFCFEPARYLICLIELSDSNLFFFFFMPNSDDKKSSRGRPKSWIDERLSSYATHRMQTCDEITGHRYPKVLWCSPASITISKLTFLPRYEKSHRNVRYFDILNHISYYSFSELSGTCIIYGFYTVARSRWTWSDAFCCCFSAVNFQCSSCRWFTFWFSRRLHSYAGTVPLTRHSKTIAVPISCSSSSSFSSKL